LLTAVKKKVYKAPMRFWTLYVGIFLLIFPKATGAFESTVWEEGDFSKARIISSHLAVPVDESDPLYIGLHIKMEKGWKTYWRTPGNAGLPPVIDWEGSINLAAAEIEYPAPNRFEIFDLQTYGYPDEVVYPIRIKPAVPSAPVTIKANVNYLVCKDLCVPVTADLTLEIPPAVEEAPLSLEFGLIETYLKMVPKAGGTKIRISNYEVLGVEGLQNLVFHLKGQNLMTGADIIVEDLGDFKFGIPSKRILSESNEIVFVVPVRAVGHFQDVTGKTVNVTLKDGWGNFQEQTIILNNKKGEF